MLQGKACTQLFFFSRSLVLPMDSPKIISEISAHISIGSHSQTCNTEINVGTDVYKCRRVDGCECIDLIVNNSQKLKF